MPYVQPTSPFSSFTHPWLTKTATRQSCHLQHQTTHHDPTTQSHESASASSRHMQRLTVHCHQPLLRMTHKASAAFPTCTAVLPTEAQAWILRQAAAARFTCQQSACAQVRHKDRQPPVQLCQAIIGSSHSSKAIQVKASKVSMHLTGKLCLTAKLYLSSRQTW